MKNRKKAIQNSNENIILFNSKIINIKNKLYFAI